MRLAEGSGRRARRSRTARQGPGFAIVRSLALLVDAVFDQHIVWVLAGGWWVFHRLVGIGGYVRRRIALAVRMLRSGEGMNVMRQRCSSCRHENAMPARFCSQCGAALSGELIQSATRLTPLMQQWRKLSTRTTRREARQLLGEPVRIDVSNPVAPPRSNDAATIEIWTYEYAATGQMNARLSGSLRFSITAGHLVSWIEPSWDEIK